MSTQELSIGFCQTLPHRESGSNTVRHESCAKVKKSNTLAARRGKKPKLLLGGGMNVGSVPRVRKITIFAPFGKK
jgi:hypothetical protein